MSELPYLILFLLVVAFSLRIDFIFYIVYVCVGIYIWSLWRTPRALAGLRASRHYPNRAFLGERVPVTLKLFNSYRLPLPWLQFNESIPPELRSGDKAHRALSLNGRETAEFTYHVQTTRRGFYRLGPLQLISGDMFGFSEQQARLAADYLTVYPRITPLAQLGILSRLPFGVLPSHQRLFEDPARPQGVREYRSGDSLRQINWKVSAHTEKLVVKTFQPAISLETAILLNLSSADYEQRELYTTAEWAIEVAASLAAHLVDRRQAVGLMCNGADPLKQLAKGANSADFDETSGRLLFQSTAVHTVSTDGTAYLPSPIPPRSGRPHLMKVLELLARIEAAETTPFDAWAPTVCLHLSWGTTILCITPAGDLATCQMLHRLVRSGFNPVLIIVKSTSQFAQIRQRSRRLGFAAYQISQKKDLRSLVR